MLEWINYRYMALQYPGFSQNDNMYQKISFGHSFFYTTEDRFGHDK